MCVLAGCWKSKPSPPPMRPVGDKPLVVAESPPAEPKGLYGLDEALADAFSGPWTFVGTGVWFGMFRVNACVYRNERVVIVNKYCTLKEKPAAGVVIMHPTRGRVFIYAEGDKPISATRRPDWFTFKAESNVPTDHALRVDAPFAELRVWDEKRYYQNAPGCFGGVELKKPQDGCYKLDAATQDWNAKNRAFLKDPPDAWYRIVAEMRERAKREARPYVDPPSTRPPQPSGPTSKGKSGAH